MPLFDRVYDAIVPACLGSKQRGFATYDKDYSDRQVRVHLDGERSIDFPFTWDDLEVKECGFPRWLIQSEDDESRTLVVREKEVILMVKGKDPIALGRHFTKDMSFHADLNFLYSFDGFQMRLYHLANLLESDGKRDVVSLPIGPKEYALSNPVHNALMQRFSYFSNNKTCLTLLPYAHVPHILPLGSWLEERALRAKETRAFQSYYARGFRVMETTNIREVDPRRFIAQFRHFNPDGSTKMNDYLILELSGDELN